MCIDQAEQFTDWQFRMLRPIARTVRKDLTPLIRLTANPGGRGHLWLKQGFVNPGPPRTVFVDPDTQKTRAFIPATVYDNSHVSSSTIRDLEGLPEPLRSAWLHGRWDVFVGQFFPEWDPEVHLCQPIDIPKGWRRFGMLDYGYAQDPSVYLQAAVGPDKRIYIYREIVMRGKVDTAQAEEIARVCANDQPEYVSIPRDLGVRSGKGGIKGMSTVETFRQVWDDIEFRAQLRQVESMDRVAGWRIMRRYLAPYPAADGTGHTALLQVFAGQCPELARTLPGLVYDEHKTEDCDTDGEDDAADSLRYGLTSRPSPIVSPFKSNPPSDFVGETMHKTARDRKWVEDRRKSWGKIGNEMERMRFERYFRRERS